MAEVEALMTKDGLTVLIPTEYLEQAFKMGVTTNETAKINHTMDMLQHFAIEFERGEDDSFFGRFIDAVCSDAIQQGEPFLD